MSLLATTAHAHGDRPALVTPDASLTWSQAARLAGEPGTWALPNGVTAFLRILGGWEHGLVAPQDPHHPDLSSRMEARPAHMGTALWTSGSGGRARLVLHDFAAHVVSAHGSSENLSFGPGDRWLWSLGHHHVGGLAIVVRAALSGGTVVLDGRLEDVSHVSVVATQLGRMLREHDGPPPGLKAVLVGGGPIPAALLDRAWLRGWPIHTTWGMTETASQVTTTAPGASRAELATAGRVLPGRELRIGAGGIIEVRGPVLMKGYWGESPVDGWWPTGDVGRLDDGLLTVLGRADHMFTCGGEKVHPEAVERVLGGHPALAAAIVVPVPDPEWGARPVAFVQLAPDCTLDPDALSGWAREHLPRQERPAAWHRLPPFAGKPDRAALARLAAELRAR